MKLSDLIQGVTGPTGPIGPIGHTGPVGPLVNHNDLPGLNIGDYLHLTNNEYTIAQQATRTYKAADIATTGNITLSGAQTIDGVATGTYRILVWQQTDATQNGIYDAGAGDWTRCVDFMTDANIRGSMIRVRYGTLYAQTLFSVTNTAAISVGATNIAISAIPLFTTTESTLAKVASRRFASGN